MNIQTNSPTNLEEQICESINELEEYVEEQNDFSYTNNFDIITVTDTPNSKSAS
jgi:hypothetical protein